MARTVRDAALLSRTARARLAIQSKLYWRALETGLHLGYRRRTTGGTWIARRRTEVRDYCEAKLGLADDLQDADGHAVLDFSQAQRAARAWWTGQQQREQDLPATDGPFTVARAISDYLADYRGRGGKAVTMITSAINAHILPALGPLPVNRLTARRIQDWHHRLAERAARVRSRKNVDPSTKPFNVDDLEVVRRRRASANRVLTYLKAALNHAWREGLVPSDNAWRRVRPFRAVDAPVIRYLKPDEIVRLLNTCPPDFRALVHVALLTGCRYGDLCRARVSDFDPDVGILNVSIHCKGNRRRHVTLTEEAVEAVQRLVAGRSAMELLLVREDGQSWRPSQQQRPLSEACVRAHIEPAISFHVLRHTHASHLAMRGVPMAVIAKQLGHADIRMTEKHYAHLAPSYVSDTIRASFPRLTPEDSSGIVSLRGAARRGVES